MLKTHSKVFIWNSFVDALHFKAVKIFRSLSLPQERSSAQRRGVVQNDRFEDLKFKLEMISAKSLPLELMEISKFDWLRRPVRKGLDSKLQKGCLFNQEFY